MRLGTVYIIGLAIVLILLYRRKKNNGLGELGLIKSGTVPKFNIRK